MKCRVCNNPDVSLTLNLGHHPPSDRFLTKEQLTEPETYYPLDLYFCDKCGLAQIGYVVPKEILFTKDYPYETGINAAGIEHFTRMAQSICDRYNVGGTDLVVDVGGNDGTLAEAFRDYRGSLVINVDPSDVESKALKIPEFWSEKIAYNIIEHWGKAKVITATNVFAHIDDLHEFMRAIDIALAPDGVFIVESPSLTALVKNLAYDTIYHEHLSYWDLKSMQEIVSQYGMYIADYAEFDFHMGSYRFHVTRGDGYKADYPFPDMTGFAEKIEKNRHKLQKLLLNLKHGGFRIAGVCASAKGNTLLNYCKIGPETLDFIAEKSKLKIGRYSPGMHILVDTDERLVTEQPEYALMLACNFRGSIPRILRNRGYKGAFIFPLPEIEFDYGTT